MKKPTSPVERLSGDRLARAAEIIQVAVARFQGQSDELEAAIGMYVLGHYVGWKALVLMHSKKTVRKYEDVLGITVRKEFPEEGSQSHRARALSIAKNLPNFWKVISGDDKSIDRKERKLLNSS